MPRERIHDRRTPSPYTRTGATRMMYSSDLMPGLTGIALELNRTSKGAFLGIDFRRYLQEMMAPFGESSPTTLEAVSAKDVPERIFQVLTDRDYCYLSADRIAPYRKDIVARVSEAVTNNQP